MATSSEFGSSKIGLWYFQHLFISEMSSSDSTPQPFPFRRNTRLRTSFQYTAEEIELAAQPPQPIMRSSPLRLPDVGGFDPNEPYTMMHRADEVLRALGDGSEVEEPMEVPRSKYASPIANSRMQTRVLYPVKTSSVSARTSVLPREHAIGAIHTSMPANSAGPLDEECPSEWASVINAPRHLHTVNENIRAHIDFEASIATDWEKCQGKGGRVWGGVHGKGHSAGHKRGGVFLSEEISEEEQYWFPTREEIWGPEDNEGSYAALSKIHRFQPECPARFGQDVEFYAEADSILKVKYCEEGFWEIPPRFCRRVNVKDWEARKTIPGIKDEIQRLAPKQVKAISNPEWDSAAIFESLVVSFSSLSWQAFDLAMRVREGNQYKMAMDLIGENWSEQRCAKHEICKVISSGGAVLRCISDTAWKKHNGVDAGNGVYTHLLIVYIFYSAMHLFGVRDSGVQPEDISVREHAYQCLDSLVRFVFAPNWGDKPFLTSSTFDSYHTWVKALTDKFDGTMANTEKIGDLVETVLAMNHSTWEAPCATAIHSKRELHMMVKHFHGSFCTLLTVTRFMLDMKPHETETYATWLDDSQVNEFGWAAKETYFGRTGGEQTQEAVTAEKIQHLFCMQRKSTDHDRRRLGNIAYFVECVGRDHLFHVVCHHAKLSDDGWLRNAQSTQISNNKRSLRMRRNRPNQLQQKLQKDKYRPRPDVTNNLHYYFTRLTQITPGLLRYCFLHNTVAPWAKCFLGSELPFYTIALQRAYIVGCLPAGSIIICEQAPRPQAPKRQRAHDSKCEGASSHAESDAYSSSWAPTAANSWWSGNSDWTSSWLPGAFR